MKDEIKEGQVIRKLDLHWLCNLFPVTYLPSSFILYPSSFPHAVLILLC
jgi:hypothetical protein